MNKPTALKEDTIATVLRRAAEIDAEGGRASREDVVTWANEAGISRGAVEAALMELEQPRPGRIQRIRLGLVTFSAGAAGFIGGAFVRIVSADPASLTQGLNAITPISVAIGTVGALALNKSNAVRERFHLLNALVWGCYVSGWSIANGVATEEIVVLGLAAGVLTAITGAIVRRMSPVEHQSDA